MELSELKKLLSIYYDMEDKRHMVIALTNPSPVMAIEALINILRDFVYHCTEHNECRGIDVDALRKEILYISAFIEDPQVREIILPDDLKK